MSFNEWLDDAWKSTGLCPGIQSLRHGKRDRWLDLLHRLEYVSPSTLDFDDTVRIGSEEDYLDQTKLRESIEALIPWRKGPFEIFGCEIDSEWQSQLKWDRIRSHINLEGKRVLDIGCSNGYFGYRMLQAGALSVLGVEAFEPFVLQAALLNFFARSANIVIPHRFGRDSLPRQFDTVFSMGVSYHQRDLSSHLGSVYQVLEPSGEVVLETLVADTDIVPQDRYANMPNVWLVPSIQTLEGNLRKSNFTKCQVLDVSLTTQREQRSTRFSPGPSLQDTLNPSDPRITIEGYTAPKRCALIARKAN